jgi:ABC-2 type transport system permease protein
VSAVWPIARWTLRDQRGGVIALSLTTFGLALMMGLLYPSYRDSFADIELPPAFEAFLGSAGSLDSPEGFLTAEVFSWIPIVIAVFAVIWGTGTLAGDEADGALDMLLAQPISREALLVGKALGLAIALSIVTLALFPGLLLGVVIADIDIGVGVLLAAVISQVPLVLLYLAVGLLAAAALPTRRAAAVITTAALVAAYAVQLIAGAIPDLADLGRITPLYWADASLEMVEGAQPLRWLGLSALAIAVVAFAVALFERREIGSGQPRRRRAGPREG